MGRHEAIESGTRQKHLQSVQYGARYSPPYASHPHSSHTSSSLLQSISPAVLAKRLAQFRLISIQVSRSVVRHPSRWLGATWLGLVLVGGVAAVTLLKIEPMRPDLTTAAPIENSTATPLPDQSQAGSNQSFAEQTHPVEYSAKDRSRWVQSEPKESLPLFALGTVAFSCAIGCLWLSYRFSARPVKEQSRLPIRPHRLPRPSTRAHRSTKAAVGVVASPVVEARSSQPAAATAGTVALVPSSEDHPLDWNEPSLADNLDIRQNRPLSRWLQD